VSANTAELTLILKAQNLAETELAKMRTSISKVATTAKQVASDVATAFKNLGPLIMGELGNVWEDISKGRDATASALMLGATLAGGVVEGLSAHLIPELLGKLGATATFAPLAAALGAEGAGLGAILAAAIPIGMAALPFLILAAAVAALTYLIVNPEARQKAHEAAMMIVGAIGDGLRALPGIVAEIFLNVVTTAIRIWWSLPGLFADVLRNMLALAGQIVGKILDVVMAIPNAVANAIAWLDTLLGKTKNLTELGVGIGQNPKGIGHAAGGWVGLNGPELAIVGEKGPEFIRPAGTGTGGGSGFTIQGVSEADILDMVDRGFYFRLQRAAPTLGRS
jgi:hypothetical protein